MRSKQFLPIILILNMALWGCTTINYKTTTTPESLTTVATEMQTPTQPTTTTVDSIPQTTPMDVAAIEMIPICPKSGIQIAPSAGFGIPGTIVYQKDFHGLYTVGGDPLAYSKLPVSEEQQFFAFGFSPDGNWFAFSPLEFSSTNEIIFEMPDVILLSTSGSKIEHTFSVASFSDELQVEHRLQGFSSYSNWINDTTIYTTLYSINPNSNTTRRINHLPKILDPFAGVWRNDLLNDLPQSARPFAKGISPDLTRILYMDENGLSLKDLGNGIDIWNDKSLFATFGALMVWSPDSATVAYTNLFDIPENRVVALISREGEMKPIIGPNLPLSELYVEDLRWSADGRFLAILVWEGDEVGDSVFIYDSNKGEFVSRCPIAKSTDTTPSLLWSPDNKYLAYVSLNYPLIIMDVQSGEIIKLDDVGRAVGWSDVFPIEWP